jgi:hypothetical protein
MKAKRPIVEIVVKEAYRKLNSFYFPSEIINSKVLTPGTISVFLDSDDSFEASGTLSARNGVLTGMSGVYSRLGLSEGGTLKIQVVDDTTIRILSATHKLTAHKPEVHVAHKSVFKRKELNYIHIPIFEPENLKDWEPQTEVDVFMAFGVLQSFTDYRYCCSTNQTLLKNLGYMPTDSGNKSRKLAKPDAILLNRHNNEYLVAEFRVKSSLFNHNHGREDIDVLVVWVDDSSERSLLPELIVSLKDISRAAAFDKSE